MVGPSSPARVDGRATGGLDAVDVLHRQHALAAVRFVGERHVHRRIAGEIAGEPLKVVQLVDQVHFLADGLGELPHQVHRVDRLVLGEHRLEGRGDVFQDLALGAKHVDDVGAANLDRHHVPLARDRAVHLRDAGGRHRMGVELAEEVLQPAAQLALQLQADLGERDGRNTILELLKFLDILARHQVRAGWRAVART